MEDSKMQLLDWLDDLCVRFIINLPQEELGSVERICFQVEEAQWFYEDFIRPLNPQLPSLSLRDFCLRIFQHCPLFAQFTPENHLAAFSEFLAYKTRVPVRGVIMLNEDMDKVLLVKGWKKSASWSFPRGKINKDEPDLDCAVREAYEETGFDLRAAGLVEDESKMKFIEVTMREQHIKLYVFRGVPTDTQFAPRTRKEISKIEWWTLASLPGYRKKKNGALNQVVNNGEVLSANKLYIVAPFLVPLKRWIAEQRRADGQRYSGGAYDSVASAYEVIPDDPVAHVEPPRFDGAATMRSDGDYNAHIPMNQLHAQAPAVDAAAELKRMLSVGNAAPEVAQQNYGPQFTANAGNLLALFKSPNSGPAAQHQPANVFASNIQPFPPQGHPQHSHFPQQWPGPPPPTSQDFYSAQQGRNGYPPAQISNLQRMQPSGIPSLHHQVGQATPAQYHQQGPGLARELEGYPQTAHQAPPSFYQQADNSPFIQETRSPMAPQPIAPPPSQLPAPKLTANAENLLNMFRNRPSPAAPASPPVQAPNQHAQNLLDAFKSKPMPPPPAAAAVAPLPSPPPNAWNQPLTSQKRGSLGGLVPASIPPSRKGSAASAQITKPTPPPPGSIGRPSPVAPPVGWSNLPSAGKPPGVPAESKPSTHKDSLLSLFKAPATPPQQSQLAPPRPDPHAGLPAELSAVASPAPKPLVPQMSSTTKARPDSQQQKVLAILQRPQQAQDTAPQAVEAVSQQSKPPQSVQPKSPATVVRRHRHESSSSRAGQNSPLPRQQTPVQILKRPVDAGKPDASPTGASSSAQTPNSQQHRSASSRPASRPTSRHSGAESISKTSGKQSDKPAFQPQILKRPSPADQQPANPTAPIPGPDPAPSRSPLSLDPAFAVPEIPSRAPEAAQDQRNKLLSLFNQPVSKPAANTTLLQNGGTRSSSISTGPATAAAPSALGIFEAAGPSQPATSPLPGTMPIKPMSRTNSLAAPSTPQTPISPSDRGFLLGYLDSVVKGAGAGK